MPEDLAHLVCGNKINMVVETVSIALTEFRQFEILYFPYVSQ